jgi:hypothetical protein
MLEWLEDEGDRLRRAFIDAFGQSCEAFGKQSTWIGGVSDGAEGVQWNASYDPRDQRQWVSVNLEGKEYDGWPVARLIRRELVRPKLLAVAENTTRTPSIEVRWTRDYWQVRARPAIREADIDPTPLPLDELTEESWRQALNGAQECLDPLRNRKGRATQRVTLLGSGQEVRGPVTPHLTVTLYAMSFQPWPEIFEEAKKRLRPYYDWATKQAR